MFCDCWTDGPRSGCLSFEVTKILDFDISLAFFLQFGSKRHWISVYTMPTANVGFFTFRWWLKNNLNSIRPFNTLRISQQFSHTIPFWVQVYLYFRLGCINNLIKIFECHILLVFMTLSSPNNLFYIKIKMSWFIFICFCCCWVWINGAFVDAGAVYTTWFSLCNAAWIGCVCKYINWNYWYFIRFPYRMDEFQWDSVLKLSILVAQLKSWMSPD